MTRSIILSVLSVLLCVGFATHLSAMDAVESELARFIKAEEKANQEFQDDVEKERAKALRSILSVIKRESKKAEPEVLDGLWTLVLELDRENEEAKSYFTSTGKLAKVMDALDKKTGILIGDGKTNVTAVKTNVPRVDMTGAKEIRITSAFGNGYTLGNHRAGTTLIFQYVEGKWSGDNEAAVDSKNQSPDAEDSSPGNRVEMFVDSGNEPKVLTIIAPGTVEKPFIYTLTEDVVGLSLRIANRDGIRRRGRGGANGQDFTSAYTGDVTYLVRIVRP